MPRFLVPHKTPSHRFKGIALFRGLLSGIKSLLGRDVSNDSKKALRNVVCNKFKRNHHLQSFKKLQVEYEAGYESLDLIRSARSGNEAHTKQLLSTLTALHSSLTESPQSAQSKRQELKKRNAPLSQGPVFSMPTPPGSILARPYPTTSGPRHVPFLISAAGYPMLRTKKPQPPGLGPYFRKLTKKRQAQTDAVTRLEGMIPIARLEDVWDLDMQRQGVLVQASQRSQSPSRLHTGAGSWVEDLRNVIKHIQEKGKAQIAKKAELTKRMQWIVEEESRLARLEEEERRAGKTIEGPTGAQDAKDT